MLVVDGGRIVEDGAPAELADNPDSLYRALLDAEIRVHAEIRGDPRWRRLWIQEGNVWEQPESLQTILTHLGDDPKRSVL